MFTRKIFSFEKLEAWKNAKSIAMKVFEITAKCPDSHFSPMANQMRRSSISISSNIAENCKASQAQFYIIAYNSMIKSLNQLIISKNMNYIDGSTLSNIREIIDSIASKLSPAKQFKYS